MAMTDFEGKTALITGAADGIGAALAEALLEAGARVFLSDINEAKLEETASRLKSPNAACDVSDAKAVDAAVEAAWTELGGVDLLCANAGVIVPGSLLDSSDEDARFIFGVNVWGVVNACRSQALRLRASERTGHILLTGSEHSLSSPEYLREMPLHLYNMTKHSVLSIGESMRAELAGNGVGVSVLCPGPVMSGLNENSEQARPDELGEQPELNISRLDPATLSGLGDLYLSAADAAAIALRGIRAGAFVIPTHAFQRKDVDARYKEVVAGFDLLE